ncbi:peptidase E [Vallicoccus soli]|uniref:Peptidase E n=1 Tax=Vallicoccus soli TaxID=2339232 RepID=A0A3A3ZLC7_9ACTN|nr:peptidase E [Vallicoccus soli]RJK96932.1 peptidase E [Vallicoccus soli]
MRILATSGGFVPGERSRLAVGPLLQHALDLAGSPSRPRLCYVGTALGDQAWMAAEVHKAFAGTGVEVSVLDLLPMPSVPDVQEHLLGQHVVWVGGGSVAGLLALWRLHGVDRAMRAAWEAGVVLGGVSAGSLCWHVGGTTDSFGPDLRPVTDGLALLPYGNGVHYDSEEQRRPLLHRLVSDGTLPLSYATDDGVGLVYEGTELVEAVSDRPGVAAYRVERGPDGRAVETRIEPRRLGPTR